jgi:hypothetical protein
MIKKNKDTRLLVLIAILAVILLGLLLYWVKVLVIDGYYNYEGATGDFLISRAKVGNLLIYQTSIFVNNQEHIFFFRNHPKDVKDIYLEPNLEINLNRPNGTQKVYVTNDKELGSITSSDSVIAAGAFEQILSEPEANIYGLHTVDVYTDAERSGNVPITCANVTRENAVIYMKLGPENKVYSENECIVIQGTNGEGLIMAAEKFAYYLLGVF